MALIRSLAEGDVGMFGVGFGHGRSCRELEGDWRILFCMRHLIV